MTTLLQDMRYGLRVLWKSPGFTIVAVLSLALGVGANTAIFSIVNAVLLRSLPFSHSDRLVKIVANNRGVGAQDIGFSVPELDDLRTRAGVFEQVTVTWPTDVNLTGAERPQRLEAQAVSPNYFPMLGISAHIGRVFGSGDEAQGFAEAVVISDSLWARGFGRDPGIYIGLNLNIPIRNRVAKADQYRSELEYRQAELRREQLKKQIRIEVRNAQYALEQSRARVESALKGRDLAERTFEITQKEQDLGAGSSYQTMTAQRDLSVAELDLVTARTIYEKARVELDRATGATLERNGVLIQDAITGTVTALSPQLMPSSAKPQDPCSVAPSGVERATLHEVDK
jgi:Outer membrane efflux protein/MacB-like periplasmic core domain